MDEKKEEEKVPTTGGQVSKEAIPGMAFDQQPPVGSKKEAELLKAREAIDKELEGIRDARGKAEFDKTEEGKKWAKDRKEFLEGKKQEQEAREKIHARLVEEAKRQYKLRRLADREKVEVDMNSKEFQDIMEDIIDVYTLVQGHYQGR